MNLYNFICTKTNYFQEKNKHEGPPLTPNLNLTLMGAQVDCTKSYEWIWIHLNSQIRRNIKLLQIVSVFVFSHYFIFLDSFYSLILI